MAIDNLYHWHGLTALFWHRMPTYLELTDPYQRNATVEFDEFEQATRENVAARRNHLVALWAGRQIGLSGDQLSRYAIAVHHADYEECGPDDVVRKIAKDFADNGLPIKPDAIMAILIVSEACARRELLVTD